MAKTHLLNTRTSTFLELIGNGKIYRVPAYQRDYSWEEEQWEDLWNDILELKDQHEDGHYMGALVVEAINDREFQIIDGQQRIATLSILALAVIQRLMQLAEQGIESADNRERASSLRVRFIGEKDPASLIETSKLFLNESDNPFYQDYLVQLRQPNNPKGLCRSNRLLFECFNWFYQKLETLPPDGTDIAKLLSETAARQLIFIVITVEDELNAYTVFETLNARGIELSATDLLKNYLFSRIRLPSDLRSLQRRWKRLIETVKQEKFPDFLRYYLLCDQAKVRKQRLFKIVRDRVRMPEQIFNLMEALESYAELFSAIGSPEHEYWLERPEAKPYIRELKLFKVKQMTPLLFAGWKKLDSPDFVRLLKLVSVISFRYAVICQHNPNELEMAYHSAASALLKGEITTLAEIYQTLKSIYIDDEVFKSDFSTKTIQTFGSSRRLVKYILCRLEHDCTDHSCDFETDPATIEHILPENPSEQWNEVFPPEQQIDYIYRLGNLTLLEPYLNRQIGNVSFEEKQAVYPDSQYGLSKQLSHEQFVSEWTPTALNQRQKKMADRAAHIWRTDF